MRRANNMDNHIMIEAAKRWALSDASDPWALARAMTHLRNGIAEYALKTGEAAYYDAEPDQNELGQTVWRNRSRP